MRIFAVGDIHGHMEELAALFEKIEEEHHMDLKKDHFVMLGDLVDVGPDSCEVLELAIQHRKVFPDTFHVLLGNHDHMAVDALSHNAYLYGDYYLWFNQGGRQTISSYFPKPLTDYEKAISQPLDYIPQEHLDFLEGLPWYWETPEFFFVHGGVAPDVSLEWFKEQFDKYPELLSEPLSPIWIREKFYWSEYDWGKKIVFAHTPFSDGKGGFKVWQRENMVGINTMPRNEGHLTCAVLDTENPDNIQFVTQEKIWHRPEGRVTSNVEVDSQAQEDLAN